MDSFLHSLPRNQVSKIPGHDQPSPRRRNPRRGVQNACSIEWVGLNRTYRGIRITKENLTIADRLREMDRVGRARS